MSENYYEGQGILFARLQLLINEAGSLRAAADKIGVSVSFLSQVRKRRKEPSKRVCEALGIERERKVIHQVRYKDKDDP